MKDDDTNSRIVHYEFDPANPPPLSDEQRERLRALAEMTDEDIDVSDIPPLGEAFWKSAVRGRFYRPVKQQVTLRLDADILAWFKSRADGQRGYQTRINAALRRAVEAEMREER